MISLRSFVFIVFLISMVHCSTDEETAACRQDCLQDKNICYNVCYTNYSDTGTTLYTDCVRNCDDDFDNCSVNCALF